jgi:hypothetical protein
VDKEVPQETRASTSSGARGAVVIVPPRGVQSARTRGKGEEEMDGGGRGGVETSQTGGGEGANDGVNHIDVAINVATGHGVRAGSLL